jgi:hypothetical protein
MLTKKLVLGTTMTAALLFGASAFANGGHGHGHGYGHGHGHNKHHWKHHYRPVVVRPAPIYYSYGYAPPPPVVVYRPAPPVVYAPVPVYRSDPDVRVNIGLRF